jgi:hypothetical protein
MILFTLHVVQILSNLDKSPEIHLKSRNAYYWQKYNVNILLEVQTYGIKGFINFM